MSDLRLLNVLQKLIIVRTKDKDEMTAQLETTDQGVMIVQLGTIDQGVMIVHLEMTDQGVMIVLLEMTDQGVKDVQVVAETTKQEQEEVTVQEKIIVMPETTDLGQAIDEEMTAALIKMKKKQDVLQGLRGAKDSPVTAHPWIDLRLNQANQGMLIRKRTKANIEIKKISSTSSIAILTCSGTLKRKLERRNPRLNLK